jgi:hypothetical protein
MPLMSDVAAQETLPAIVWDVRRTRRAHCFSDADVRAVINQFAASHPGHTFAILARNTEMVRILLPPLDLGKHGKGEMAVVRRTHNTTGWANGAYAQYGSHAGLDALRGYEFDALLVDGRGLSENVVRTLLDDALSRLWLKTVDNAHDPCVRVFLDPPVVHSDIAFLLPSL